MLAPYFNGERYKYDIGVFAPNLDPFMGYRILRKKNGLRVAEIREEKGRALGPPR